VCAVILLRMRISTFRLIYGSDDARLIVLKKRRQPSSCLEAMQRRGRDLLIRFLQALMCFKTPHFQLVPEFTGI
jgi:hypothetical protein